MSLNLVDAVLLAVKYATRLGASEAEAYAVKARSLEATWRPSSAYSMRYAEQGLGIRVALNDKRIGFAYTSKLDPSGIAEAAEKAVKAAKASKPDPYWPGLPEPPDSYPKVRNAYDPLHSRVAPSKLYEHVSEILVLQENYKERAKIVLASMECSVEERAIASSNGVHAHVLESLSVLGVAAASIEENGASGPMVEVVGYGKPGMPPYKRLATMALDWASRYHGAKERAEPITCSVIFSPKALAEILESTLVRALDAEIVARKRSPLTGKLGEEIAAPIVTLVDDGLAPDKAMSTPFDDEGCPSKRTVLIEKGVLKSYIADHYWGSRIGMECTGNGFREGTATSYQSTPRPTPTNLVLEKGDASLEEMIAETRRGVLVLDVRGAHTALMETGTFNVVAAPAWLIIDGELKPAEPVMIYGSAYELLKAVDMIGKEHVQFGSMVLPWVRVEKLNVTPQS